MDKFLRQLTHDDDLFNEQWPSNSQKMHNLCREKIEEANPDFILSTCRALVDYVHADSGHIHLLKDTLVNGIFDRFSESANCSLNELVDIFCQILTNNNVSHWLNLTLLHRFYNFFKLGRKILENSSADSVTKIFSILQRRAFIDGSLQKKIDNKWRDFLRTMLSDSICDGNRLNQKEILTFARPQTQELFRWAVKFHEKSTIWATIVIALGVSLEDLFDSYVNLSDGRTDLQLHCEFPKCSIYIDLLIKSYEKNARMFQENELQIYKTIETLVLNKNINESSRWIDSVVVPHFRSASQVEALVQTLIRLCSSVDQDLRSIFVLNILRSLVYELTQKKCPKTLAPLVFDLALAIVRLTVAEAPCQARVLLNMSDFYPWKQLEQPIGQMVEACAKYDVLINESPTFIIEDLENILTLINQRAKVTTTIYKSTHPIAIKSVEKWLKRIDPRTQKSFSNHVFFMGKSMLDLIDTRQINIDDCRRIITILHEQLEQDEGGMSSSYEIFIGLIGFFIANNLQRIRTFPLDIHQKLTQMFVTILQRPLKDESGTMRHTMMVLIHIGFRLLTLIQTEDEFRHYEVFSDVLYQNLCEEEETNLRAIWSILWSTIGVKYPNIAMNHLNQFFDDIFRRKDTSLVPTLVAIYPKCPGPFIECFDDIFKTLIESEGSNFINLSTIFQMIVNDHPELINADYVDQLFDLVKQNTYDEYSLHTIFQILSRFADARPSLFDKHRDQMIQYVSEENKLEAYQCLNRYFLAMIILGNEQTADECLTILINMISGKASTELKLLVFNTCQMIGTRHKQSLAKKRAALLPFKSEPACQFLIDMIDGNKLTEEHQALINRSINDIMNIEQRIVRTETHVDHITKTVENQQTKITELDGQMTNVHTQLNTLAEQVDQQAAEIERIDRKTLSHVPGEWGGHVCKLLNARATNDWRLLGKRFGYSSSELKHWAMQLDPSMSLLNEWFLTHKTDEATYGLLKVLTDIGRTDCEKLIRDALANVGQLIPDDLPMEIKRLPPIFISYQWSSQKAVLRLKENLQKAGYACWMDTGEMGGGDKLFSKIDAGIRGAKVVICCMNKAYAQSDNCSREVHLTVTTGKPLIPLQMEKQLWPPEGALGPIMSEYLFIRFFDRKANDENYWPKDRFAELLAQIRYHVAPDPDMITDEYRNWFVPRLDHLIFVESNSIDQRTPLVVTHPQIMISYQWDYQKDIISLYEKLTQLGYRCWLDIFQMGGGDSLFDKIDQGIRNAKCVLSCVTPKYTKSINCRREMALADALKRPIVPLLIEQTATWPPDGPMSMVFAEKSYIDFQKVNGQQQRWFGKSFEHLLARLKQEIPEVQVERPDRHLLDMTRPATGKRLDENKPNRVSSAPTVVQSRTCLIM